MKDAIKLLDKKKIEFNFNKNPIKVDLLLSFLKIPTEINRNHLGYSNGWTQKVNKEHNLIIRGGLIGGVDYLDSIQYGKNLENSFNNYVNPFYLFDIMNEQGKDFFKQYYKEDINDLIEKQKNKLKNLNSQIEKESELLIQLQKI